MDRGRAGLAGADLDRVAAGCEAAAGRVVVVPGAVGGRGAARRREGDLDVIAATTLALHRQDRVEPAGLERPLAGDGGAAADQLGDDVARGIAGNDRVEAGLGGAEEQVRPVVAAQREAVLARDRCVEVALECCCVIFGVIAARGVEVDRREWQREARGQISPGRGVAEVVEIASVEAVVDRTDQAVTEPELGGGVERDITAAGVDERVAAEAERRQVGRLGAAQVVAQLAEAAGVAAAIAGSATAEADVGPGSPAVGALYRGVAQRDATDQIAIGVGVERDALAAGGDADAARQDVCAGAQGQAAVAAPPQVDVAVEQQRGLVARLHQQAAVGEVERMDQDIAGTAGATEGDLREAGADVRERCRGQGQGDIAPIGKSGEPAASL